MNKYRLTLNENSCDTKTTYEFEASQYIIEREDQSKWQDFINKTISFINNSNTEMKAIYDIFSSCDFKLEIFENEKWIAVETLFKRTI